VQAELPARRDAAQELTTDLTRRFETIVIEDLNVSGMAKNHSLAGAVLDCGFYEIRRQLEYKAKMRGGRILVADRFYPSTQICSCVRVAAHSPAPKGARNWVSNGGFAANAAHNISVMRMPRSI
jgi:putative transposase